MCDVLERIAQATDPTASVWKGSTLPTHKQGIKVLGTPLGHPDFVRDQLRQVTDEHQMLLRRIPAVRDVQCSWLLLLHCASARACYHLRAVRPSAAAEFADRHDQDLWQCLSTVLQNDLSQCLTRSVPVQLCLLPLEVWASGVPTACASQLIGPVGLTAFP